MNKIKAKRPTNRGVMFFESGKPVSEDIKYVEYEGPLEKAVPEVQKKEKEDVEVILEYNPYKETSMRKTKDTEKKIAGSGKPKVCTDCAEKDVKKKVDAVRQLEAVLDKNID